MTRLAFALSFILLGSYTRSVHGMTNNELSSLRQETRHIFYHGFTSYMDHAFPEDELRPISCAPLTRDRANPAHIEVNDVLGNYSLTLIDSLSTLAILASTAKSKHDVHDALTDFKDGVKRIVEMYGDGTGGRAGLGKRARGFDLDSKVQVFETTIRGLGGLLSAHLFAAGELPIKGYDVTWLELPHGTEGVPWPEQDFVYNGQLLRLAQDLGERLLPAFHTPTGLPYPRVNLRYGIPFYDNSPLNNDAEHGQCSPSQVPRGPREITETCSAGAGSLVLEFTTLSRLTGDMRFENLAKRAFWAVWERRSASGLVGAGIDAETGLWVSPYTGIGAGIDSFFEYAFKSSVLLSGLSYEFERSSTDSADAFLQAWQQAHAGIKHHVYRGSHYQHPHYAQVDLYTGALRAFWIDSLSAYYPGLLTLAGELDEAIETHLLYTALWMRYSALPERWSTTTGEVESGLRWWGGRPEFIESTWYLYRATKDPWYLHVGEMALRDIKRRCWTKCGWAGLQDVRTGEQSDRMESFFLGETVKYLYLLFDEEHLLNHVDAPVVFTTEGHPLVIPSRLRGTRTRSRARAANVAESVSAPTCPAPPPMVPFTVSATAAREDIFHAAALARLHLMPSPDSVSSPLVEFSSDHPSVSLTDVQSPTNYTFYPWTLPADLVPVNGMCKKMDVAATFDLSFPTLPNTVLNARSLVRIDGGIKVESMSGLRLGMVRESTAYPESRAESAGESTTERYRIYTVSGILLGRDEKVVLSMDSLVEFSPIDPHFTRVKDLEVVDLIVDVPVIVPSTSPNFGTQPTDQNYSNARDLAEAEADPRLDLMQVEMDPEGDVVLDLPNEVEEMARDPNYLASLLQSLFGALPTRVPTSHQHTPSNEAEPAPMARQTIEAMLPTGPGAALLPSSIETNDASTSPLGELPWTRIHILDGELCDQRLPLSVAKTNHVLVIRRGGCTFSQKLANVPSFAPSSTSLRLVVVVGFPEHDEQGGARVVVTPFLERQMTPAGLERREGLNLVLVAGGESVWRAFEAAAGRVGSGGGAVEGNKSGGGVGVRRRYWFSSDGVRIANLIVV
ncbi:hypothetical protein LTR66_002701 [Elasticomyces elasticus]|nr:hypothetical protein LTR66_002701 [Elasticomyces elasticus]